MLTMLGEQIGPLASRYPDGETGVRENWIRWQAQTFANHPDFLPGSDDSQRGYTLKDEVDPAQLSFGDLGYAAEALASYETFKRLRTDGVVPAGVRFQVSLPTPIAVISLYVADEHGPLVEPAYDLAMQRELATILEEIAPEDLAIQWDIAIETTSYDGGRPLYEQDPLGHATATVAKMTALTSAEVHTGIHLCYGDSGHKHIIEPTDLATSVLFANSICAATPHALTWVHVAVPRDRDDPAYFAPLAELEIGEAELVLGLVHHTDGLAGTKRRMQTANQFVIDYGIATECGFGRRPQETIPDLLQIHIDAATN